MPKIQLPSGGTIEGSELKEIKLADWLAEGERLFGPDKKLWKFICPNCGHIQSIADFLELRNLKIVPSDFNPGDVVYYSCIGRWDTRIPVKDIGTVFDKKSPCNYTNGGLFCFAKRFIVDDGNDGKKVPVFDFAREE